MEFKYEAMIEEFLEIVADDGLDYAVYFYHDWKELEDIFPDLYEKILAFRKARKELAATVLEYAERYEYGYISGLN